METTRKATLIKSIIEDRKAIDVVQIDLDGKSLMADAMIICSATSQTHARAIADAVALKMKEAGARADHIETDPENTWIVMDFGDLVLHVFQEEQRAYYDLEELWKAPSGSRRQKKEVVETPEKPTTSRKGLYTRWTTSTLRSRKLSDR
jgi:ribosome-associated protein